MLIDDGLEILTDAQCAELLSQRSLGRIAVTIGGLPVILPVNYVYRDGAVVFRTSEGAKLRAASRGVVVAFEIDGYDAAQRAGWSVLVIGRASEIIDPIERARIDGSSLAPWVPGDRHHYVRVDAELVTGRRISGTPDTVQIDW